MEEREKGEQGRNDSWFHTKLACITIRDENGTEKKKFCRIPFSLVFHPREEVSYLFSWDPVFILQTHIYHVLISFLVYERYVQQLHVNV